jgi:hypothetical protein
MRLVPFSIGQAPKMRSVQTVMETRKAFAVETECDFEKFVTELTGSLKKANHAGWLALGQLFSPSFT